MKPWQPWYGGKQPVNGRQPVKYRLRDDYSDIARAEELHWEWADEESPLTAEDDIVAYAVVTEREYIAYLNGTKRLHPVHALLYTISRRFTRG